jgi:hypothetical protein
MPISVPPVVIAVKDPAFLAEIEGVYRMPRRDRIAGAVIVMTMFGVAVPLVLLEHVSVVVAIVMCVFAVVATADGATATVMVSEERIERRSRLRIFDLVVPMADVRSVRVLGRGARVRLRIEYGSGSTLTFPVSVEQRERILRLADTG